MVSAVYRGCRGSVRSSFLGGLVFMGTLGFILVYVIPVLTLGVFRIRAANA